MDAMIDTPRMTVYTAMSIVYGMVNATEDAAITAYQTLIDSRDIWSMPGTYGRMAQHYIDEGVCSCG